MLYWRVYVYASENEHKTSNCYRALHEALIVFSQLDVKLFGGDIACYIGASVCMRLKMSIKQVIVKGLCMKL